jgi:2,4-dienoyl-CoA reductase-like NADH-dependent reductase (Old Yellow Enzyme family)/thioredoxin reductase
MGVGAYNEDETVSEDYISFIKVRAPETGLVITTGARVSSKYSTLKFFGCYDDSFLSGLRSLAKTAHQAGAKIFLQILELGGTDPESPYVPSCESPVYSDEWESTIKPKPLEISQIQEIIEDFVQASRRAQEAGFDGVELDGAENFLVSDFLCPYFNRRRDRYGGNFENRLRFAVDIVRGIKSVCGRDYPVGFKFNAFYDIPQGINLELGVKIADRMASEGVSYIHEWSFARLDKPLSMFKFPPMPNLYQPRNTTIPIAQNLKAHIDTVPIIAAGGILKPAEADRIIEEGKADLVAVGRAFIAEPLWALKARTGETVRPCIRCHVCHHEVAVEGNKIVCSVNPDVFLKNIPSRTSRPKDVMVVGAGPCGIMAAVTAAARGHTVTLYEKERHPGGKLLPGSAPGFKHEFKDLLRYFRELVEKSAVKLVTGVTVTPDFIEGQSPDILVVAIGAEPVVVDIQGARGERVIDAVEALNHADAYRGQQIVVIGGGDVGCETALHLSRKKNKVTIVEKLDELMKGEEIKHNTAVLEVMLKQAGIEIYTGAFVTGIFPALVTVQDKEKREIKLSADLVILATGYQPVLKKVNALLNACQNSCASGDCVEPNRLRQAVSDGFGLGSRI